MGPRPTKARSAAARFRDAGLCFMVSIYTYLSAQSQPKKACAKKNMATDEAERPKASKRAGYDARSVRRIDNVELLTMKIGLRFFRKRLTVGLFFR
jgi:hypothetical protein